MIDPDKKFWKVDRPVILVQVGESKDIRDVKVPDDSILVGFKGLPMEVSPQLIISPEGRYEPWNITLTPDGRPDMVQVNGLTCTHCASKDTKHGYRVDAPGGPEEVDCVVQCPNCRAYLFTARGKRHG
jgi:hypothetical protein